MPLPEAFRTFMEYLLTRLDHSDERAVKAAYDIYGQSSAGGVELKELKSLLLMPYEKDEAKTEPESLDDTEPEEPEAYAAVGQTEQDGKRDASIWKQIFRGESTVQELLAAVWEKLWKTTGGAAGRPAGGAAGRLAGGAAGRPAGEKAGSESIILNRSGKVSNVSISSAMRLYCPIALSGASKSIAR